MPKVTGVLETALYVEDLERAVQFYEKLFGFPRMVGIDRLIALKVCDGQVLLICKRGASLTHVPPHDGQGQVHIAFAIPKSDYEAWEQRLQDLGVTIEQRTEWPEGGHSLYFRDPDGHLLELATPGTWPNY